MYTYTNNHLVLLGTASAHTGALLTWGTGKVVVLQPQFLQFSQLAQFSRNGTWGIQNSVKTYRNQVTLSYWYDLTEERKPMP